MVSALEQAIYLIQKWALELLPLTPYNLCRLNAGKMTDLKASCEKSE